MPFETTDVPACRPLNALVWRWSTIGETPRGQRLEGTESFEWLPGGHFLLHRFDVLMYIVAVRGSQNGNPGLSVRRGSSRSRSRPPRLARSVWSAREKGFNGDPEHAAHVSGAIPPIE